MTPIDVLHDDDLLAIFDFYVVRLGPGKRYAQRKRDIEAWQSLVHVCRRWRCLVFASPRRLDLRLVCTPGTSTRERLYIWPSLPLIVDGNIIHEYFKSVRVDNFIVALGHRDRICRIDLRITQGSAWNEVLATMKVSFPALTHLLLECGLSPAPIIPDSFLNGYAPRLKYLSMEFIPFPGIAKLLLSATHLVHLSLTGIPHSGYISPKAMAALLSVLSSLKTFTLGFYFPQSRPERESRSLHPPKRSILPALYCLGFSGVAEYLEELVTRIDTPELNTVDIDITFIDQIDFDCPRLAQFINCTPTLRALDEARVQFHLCTTNVKLRYRTFEFLDNVTVSIHISYREPDQRLSPVSQVCNSFLHTISTVEDLYIEHKDSQLVLKNDAVENTLWLQLLLPFTAAKNLYLSKKLGPGIAAALQELVRGRIAEVLPSLQNIFVEGLGPSGLLRENIEQFVAARQLSGHHVAISDWPSAPI